MQNFLAVTNTENLFILSVFLAAISSIAGMIVSGLFNFASDSSIVLVQFVLFLAPRST